MSGVTIHHETPYQETRMLNKFYGNFDLSRIRSGPTPVQPRTRGKYKCFRRSFSFRLTLHSYGSTGLTTMFNGGARISMTHQKTRNRNNVDRLRKSDRRKEGGKEDRKEGKKKEKGQVYKM